jgi:hypothetical protein
MAPNGIEEKTSSQHRRQASAMTVSVRMIETQRTQCLCRRWKERILPRICAAGVLTKHTMMVQVVDQAGKPPLVRAQVVEETKTGRCRVAHRPRQMGRS